MRRKADRTSGRSGPAGLSAAWLGGLVAVICVAMALSPRAASAAGGAVAIVVNPSTPVDDLSVAELRKIFLGERQFWSPSLRVVLLVRGPGAHERDVALHSIYQMSEAQFHQYWIAMIMRAEVTSGPKTVSSAEMTNQLIAGIPGSIGFVPADKVQPGVKVLRINGKRPGENGYPLQ